MGSNQLYRKNKCFEPIYRLPKGVEDLFNLLNTEFFNPRNGLEGYLCPGINILGNIYNIDTPICTSGELLTFE